MTKHNRENNEHSKYVFPRFNLTEQNEHFIMPHKYRVCMEGSFLLFNCKTELNFNKEKDYKNSILSNS